MEEVTSLHMNHNANHNTNPQVHLSEEQRESFRTKIGSYVEETGANSLRAKSLPYRLFREELILKQQTRIKVKDMYEALLYIQTRKEMLRLIAYLIYSFLFVLVMIMFFQPGELYGQTYALKELFLDEEFPNTEDSEQYFKKNFFQISNYEEYWEWVQGPIINGIYNQEFFPGSPFLPNSTNQLVLPYGIGGNRVISSIRFRTSRVRADDDKVCKDFGLKSEELPPCYPSFSHSAKQTGEWNDFPYLRNLSSVRGIVGYVSTAFSDYGSEGYVYHLPLYSEAKNPLNPDEARMRIQSDLIEKNWTDEATRLLVVEFNLINVNIGNAMVVRFVLEIMASGGMFSYWRMYPMIINPLSRTTDIGRAVVQGLYLGFSLLYSGEFVYRMCRVNKFSYWLVWESFKVLFPLIIIVLIFCFEFYKFNSDFFAKLTNAVDLEGDGFYDAFEDARHLNYLCVLACLNLCIHLVQTFMYLRWAQTFTLGFAALRAAAPEIIALLMLFLLFTTAFAVIGHVLFGAWVNDFHSIPSSYSTLFRLLVGQLDFERIYEVEPNFAALYFMIVIFVNVFVLLNMFIAVISSFYAVAKQRNQRISSIFQEGERHKLVKTSWGLWWTKCHIDLKLCLSPCTRRLKRCFRLSKQRLGMDVESGKDVSPSSISPKPSSRMAALNMHNRLNQIINIRPSNWQVGHISPDALRDEMEKWMKKSIDERVQLSQNNGGSRNPNPYRKLWWWAVHKIAAQYHIFRIEWKNNVDYLAKARKEQLQIEVATCRKRLEELFGYESSFRRNWFVAKGISSNVQEYVSLSNLRFKQEQHIIRYKIYQILEKGFMRHRRKGVELFELFDLAWQRMSLQSKRSSSLMVKDLAQVLGFVENSEDEEICAREIKKLLQYVEDLHVVRPDYSYSVQVEEEKTKIDDVKEEIKVISKNLKALREALSTMHDESNCNNTNTGATL